MLLSHHDRFMFSNSVYSFSYTGWQRSIKNTDLLNNRYVPNCFRKFSSNSLIYSSRHENILESANCQTVESLIIKRRVARMVESRSPHQDLFSELPPGRDHGDALIEDTRNNTSATITITGLENKLFETQAEACTNWPCSFTIGM